MEGAEITMERLGYVMKATEHGRLEEQVFCAFLGEVPREDFIPYVADFFLQLEDTKWTIVAGVVNGSFVVSVRNIGYTRNAGEFVRKLFAGYRQRRRPPRHGQGGGAAWRATKRSSARSTRTPSRAACWSSRSSSCTNQAAAEKKTPSRARERSRLLPARDASALRAISSPLAPTTGVDELAVGVLVSAIDQLAHRSASDPTARRTRRRRPARRPDCGRDAPRTIASNQPLGDGERVANRRGFRRCEELAEPRARMDAAGRKPCGPPLRRRPP